MGLWHNLTTAALITGMYLSNPDDDSFHRYIDKQMRREGSHWLERKIASMVSSNACKREDYYLFSLMRIPIDRVTYLGIFGNWFLLPSSLTPPKPASN